MLQLNGLSSYWCRLYLSSVVCLACIQYGVLLPSRSVDQWGGLGG